jgi:hypothetical protein
MIRENNTIALEIKLQEQETAHKEQLKDSNFLFKIDDEGRRRIYKTMVKFILEKRVRGSEFDMENLPFAIKREFLVDIWPEDWKNAYVSRLCDVTEKWESCGNNMIRRKSIERAPKPEKTDEAWEGAENEHSTNDNEVLSIVEPSINCITYEVGEVGSKEHQDD